MEVGGEGEYIYLSLYTVTTRMTCIKMSSDESHFNVSLSVRNKVTRPCPQTTTFLKRKESPSAYQPTALPALSFNSVVDELMLNVLRCHETY